MCIIQDRQGFLWIGTQGGLNRYDGYTFTVYKHNVEDTNSLHDNYVQAIYEDRKGFLWIGTRGALHRFDSARGKFTLYIHDPANKHTISNNIINSICEDSAGILWVGTDNGLNRFDSEKQEFIRYFHDTENPVSLGGNGVKALFTDRRGTFWIGTTNGLDYFDSQRKRFVHFRMGLNNPQSLTSNSVTTIYQDRRGTLWIGTDDGLNSLDWSSWRFKHYRHDPDNLRTVSDNYITTISEDETGNLWVGTDIGINRFDQQTGSFRQYVNDPLNPNSLSSNRVVAIQSEPSGTVWIGTLGGGLNKIDRNKEQFGHIVRDPNNPESLSNNLIWSICEDHKGFLWVGTDDGLDKVDRSTGIIKHYKSDRKNPNSLSDNSVFSLLETRSGELWVGTQQGLNLLDRNSGTFTRFAANPKDTTALASSSIASLYEDHFGTVWIGTSGEGLHQYDQVTKRFRRLGPRSTVASIFEDHEGTLWICTWITGLFRFNRTSGEFKQYVHDPNNSTSISHNTVYAIQETFEGGKSVLWLGTRSGFNKLDPTTGKFKRYYEKDGLPGDLIYGVLLDNAGDLWLSSQNGLARFNPRTGAIRIFDAADGLQSNEFQNGAFHKSRSGELFFGGMNGLNAFYPERIKENSYIAPVALTAFKVFEKSVAGLHSVTDGGSLHLNYDENFFSFEFAILHFTNPQKNQYAYKLDGFDNDWVNSGSRRYASYTNVEPGKYVFRVKAANPSGVWNEKEASVKLTISPPIWKTWWAYTLYVLSMLSAIYMVRRYEMNRIRLKNSLELETIEAVKLKELDRMKSRFFANISHEFRTPLTLILGQVDSVMSSNIDTKEKGKLQVALRNARRLLQLINQLLDLSKIEAGSMELRAERHNLVSFLKNVIYSFESLAEQKKISLEFRSDETQITVLFEQDKMEKVFYNLLSNAFKFTPEGGQVSIGVKVTGSRIGEGEKRRTGESEKRRMGEQGSPIHPFSHSPIHSDEQVVQIIVQDTGIGIPNDQLPHVFDRFYQVDNSQTREHEGTGIGLALTKELVELHHGSITVTSKQGEGTEFVVLLPLGRSHLKDEKLLEERNGETESGRIGAISDSPIHPFPDSLAIEVPEGQLIILVVEDNDDVRAYIREQLEGSYKIIEAANGEEGIAKAQEGIPDLIITDLMMPRMDGYQFTQKIRGNEKTSHIPIVMLTAKAALDDKIEGLEKGVDVYLTKPFSAKELKVQVKNLIMRREELRRRFSTATIIKPSEVGATSIDKAFLEKIIKFIETHFEDENFGVEELAKEASMSISQLNRKLHALIDQPAGELIRSMRLQRAADLLKQNAGTVAEISYKLGFTDQAYFSRAFKKQFGCTPSEYKKRKGESETE